ncbi:MAG: CotH kinase family protein [Isosphaeraceae bacterium]
MLRFAAWWAFGSAVIFAPPALAEDPVFSGREVPAIRITVASDELEKLRAEPRSYVRADLREGETSIPLGLKLKGAAGSFRDWDDRPALTLNARKFGRGEYRGLGKFHLNNSVQDESYLDELICSELFRKAGVPAPRVGHARVWLNGRDVGLYVLKEGFDRGFLARSFPDPRGNLYDGGFVQDLDAELEKDEGDGVDDRSDLRAIVAAASDPDPASRARRLETLVDMDAFLAFMAMERITCHWDGYVNNANNYRLYFPTGGRAVFLPHGMDQMFGDIDMPLFEHSDRLVAAPVMQSDALRRRYRERLRELLPLASPPDDLLRRVDEAASRLRPTIEAMGREPAEAHAQQVADLKARIADRAERLVAQLGEPEQELLAFDARGEVRLEGWEPWREGEQAVVEEVLDGNARSLRIRAGDEPCVAAWRRDVLLGPGTYTLHANARAEGVAKFEDDDRSGVSVREERIRRDRGLLGTFGPKTLTYRFRVREDRKRVPLMLEMRARAGEVRFDPDSLRLVREPEPRAAGEAGKMPPR